MDFGKISDPIQLSRIRFNLPPQDERSPPCDRQTSSQRLEVFIGCPIWGKKEWIGTLYPKGTSQGDFLKYYAQHFNTIELNTTFYRIPDSATVAKWRNQVPKHFRFSPKFFQEISRFESLTQIPDLTHRFCQSVLEFGDRLGTSFLQLPPSFDLTRLPLLKRFFRLLPKGFQLSVEFRHPSWFRTGKLITPAFEILAESGVGTVITDTAGRRDVVHTSLTTHTAMIRFLGNRLHPSDTARILDWLDMIEDWAQSDVQTLYFFVHQPNEEGTLELIDLLVDEMNKRLTLKLKTWDRGIAHPQGELFG